MPKFLEEVKTEVSKGRDPVEVHHEFRAVAEVKGERVLSTRFTFKGGRPFPLPSSHFYKHFHLPGGLAVVLKDATSEEIIKVLKDHVRAVTTPTKFWGRFTFYSEEVASALLAAEELEYVKLKSSRWALQPKGGFPPVEDDEEEEDDASAESSSPTPPPT